MRELLAEIIARKIKTVFLEDLSKGNYSEMIPVIFLLSLPPAPCIQGP